MPTNRTIQAHKPGTCRNDNRLEVFVGVPVGVQSIQKRGAHLGMCFGRDDLVCDMTMQCAPATQCTPVIFVNHRDSSASG
jgi:hypothetical protein